MMNFMGEKLQQILDLVLSGNAHLQVLHIRKDVVPSGLDMLPDRCQPLEAPAPGGSKLPFQKRERQLVQPADHLLRLPLHHPLDQFGHRLGPLHIGQLTAGRQQEADRLLRIAAHILHHLLSFPEQPGQLKRALARFGDHDMHLLFGEPVDALIQLPCQGNQLLLRPASPDGQQPFSEGQADRANILIGGQQLMHNILHGKLSAFINRHMPFQRNQKQPQLAFQYPFQSDIGAFLLPIVARMVPEDQLLDILGTDRFLIILIAPYALSLHLQLHQIVDLFQQNLQ
ncbi:hypothetical protein D3C75_694290 [compost metagenome]